MDPSKSGRANISFAIFLLIKEKRPAAQEQKYVFIRIKFIFHVAEHTFTIVKYTFNIGKRTFSDDKHKTYRHKA